MAHECLDNLSVQCGMKIIIKYNLELAQLLARV